MANIARTGLLAAALFACATLAANSASAPTYILNGYTFDGLTGVNTGELLARLKHKEGDRITRAEIVAEQAILAKELKARQIEGRLFTTIAEKHGRIWIMFDLQQPAANIGGPIRRLESQKFEGATHIAAGVLAAATGLKDGEVLSLENLRAARRAILAEYAHSMPSGSLSLKTRMQTRPDGKVRLTWIIAEPK
jgi:outer membrane protein assembly factor BamA